MVGIVLVVLVQEMALQNVVMGIVLEMKIIIHAQKIVMLQENVLMGKLLIVMVLVNVIQKHGLGMDFLIVKINNTALI